MLERDLGCPVFQSVCATSRAEAEIARPVEARILFAKLSPNGEPALVVGQCRLPVLLGEREVAEFVEALGHVTQPLRIIRRAVGRAGLAQLQAAVELLAGLVEPVFSSSNVRAGRGRMPLSTQVRCRGLFFAKRRSSATASEKRFKAWSM